MPERKTPWTDEMIERMRQLANQSYSYRRIAVELNRQFNTGFSKQAVLGKAARLGIENGRRAGRPDVDVLDRKPRVRAFKHSTSVRTGLAVAGDNKPKAKADPDAVPLDLSVALDWPISGRCKYPYGPVDGEYRFCGREAVKEKPYCEAHCALCFEGYARKHRAAA